MKKVKELIKNNIGYTIFFIILLLMTLSTFLISYYPIGVDVITIDLDKYGKIITTSILIISILYFFVLVFVEKKKIKLENVFLILAIPIGIIYMVVFPLGTVPDEREHFYRAYEISLGHLVSEQSENGAGGRNLPSSLWDIFLLYGSENAESWFNRVKSIELSEKETYMWFSNTSLYSFISYLPQSLGIAATRIFTDNAVAIAYGGRIFNFATFILLIYFTVKLIPFKKNIAMLISFLPIVFQEAISLAPDAFTIAISMFFIAYIFYLKYTRDNILKKKDYVILSLFSILIALCKIIYLPLCFLIFIIPKERFRSKKQKYISLVAIILLAIIINLLWLRFASRYLIEYNEGVNSKEQIIFVLTNPISYIIIVVRSILAYGQAYIGNILGDLSLLNISISNIYKYLLLFVLVIGIFTENSNENKVSNSTKIIVGISFILVMALLFTSLYVQWTPLKSVVINGVQGRYFIPVLILLPFLFNNSYITLNKKISMRYFISAMLFVNLHSLTCVMMFYR